MAPISHERKLEWIPVDTVIPNDRNPRQAPQFTPEKLQDLRNSINQHGILQPVTVVRYGNGMYRLVDGERRLNTAKLEGIKEIPAIILDGTGTTDEVVLMYNIHHLQKGWEMAESLMAIKDIIDRNPDRPLEELASELGMSTATLRDRMAVLAMGDDVVRDIRNDKIEYSSALRVHQTTNLLVKKRPALVEKLGGEKALQRKLLGKAKRRGISQELVEHKKDLSDPAHLPDAAVERYVQEPDTSMFAILKESRQVERKKVDELADKLKRTELDIRSFDVELAGAPNLRVLRRRLVALQEAAQELEIRVVEAERKSSKERVSEDLA